MRGEGVEMRGLGKGGGEDGGLAGEWRGGTKGGPRTLPSYARGEERGEVEWGATFLPKSITRVLRSASICSHPLVTSGGGVAEVIRHTLKPKPTHRGARNCIEDRKCGTVICNCRGAAWQLRNAPKKTKRGGLLRPRLSRPLSSETLNNLHYS